jgi:hypothetical protein
VPKRVSDDDFIAAWAQYGGPDAVSKATGLSIRSVYSRRNNLVEKGHNLATRTTNPCKGKVAAIRHTQTFERRRKFNIRNGKVIVFSDAHYWPGEPSLAHLALLEVIRREKPTLVVANGDVLDGARITRHEPRGWMSTPTVKEELDVLVERMGEIEDAAGPGTILARTLGNHCIRLERWLVTRTPEVEDLPGTRLEDYIPRWPCSWSVQINDDTIIKHRWKGGIHATYRNTLESGFNIVTGHLHSMKAAPYTDLRDEIRWGVDAGCLADPDHDCFDYVEDNPTNWRSGFVVLTFRDGRMLWPEFCYRYRGAAWFRGEMVK